MEKRIEKKAKKTAKNEGLLFGDYGVEELEIEQSIDRAEFIREFEKIIVRY